MTMFEAAKDLRAAIESILAQTFTEFEFLIVDDGSRDGSVAIVESYNDARIRLIRNAENKGQTACLNQGLAIARGEWIARQDADDISLPHRLERQMQRLAAEPRLVLLGCQAWIVDGSGKFAGLLNVPHGPASIEWASLFENPFIHTAAVFRREAAMKLGGYDENFRICQDYDFWIRMVREEPAANLSERLVIYRHSADSLQHRARATVREEERRVLHRVWAHAFPNTPLAAGVQAALENFRAGTMGDRAFYHCLLAEYRALHPSLIDDRDLRRTTALHLVKMSRSTRSVAGFGRALATDPGLILRLVGERLAGPFIIPR